jgi:hypothetical protein
MAEPALPRPLVDQGVGGAFFGAARGQLGVADGASGRGLADRFLEEIERESAAIGVDQADRPRPVVSAYLL